MYQQPNFSSNTNIDQQYLSNPTAYYITQDTATASWLHSRGHILLRTLTSKSPYLFVFNNTKELLQDVSCWQQGTAIANCVQFENSRRILMRIVKQQGNGNYG